MKRRLLINSGAVVALAAAAFAACSNAPTTSGAQPVAGSSAGGSVASGGASGASTTAGVGTGGTTAAAGTGGNATAGTPPGGGAGGAGTGGGSAVGPACKPVTAVNGSGLTLHATDVSAFKFAPSPAENVTKVAYDPISKVVVILTQDGKMFSVDPNAPLPTTASTAAVTATKPYDAGGYTANPGFTDHRGIVFGPDGTLYVLAGAHDPIGVNIKKGVPGAGGGQRTWTTLVTTSQGFPAGGTDFDHNFSGITISPDGTSLYFSSGSRSDHGETEKGLREVPLSSAVFKVPTATPTDLKNDEAALKGILFADGTRNAFDMAFNAAGDLIATDNGPDMDLPDEVNFLEQGKHYGFPWRFGNVDNPVRDAAYAPSGDKRLHPGYGAVDKGTYAPDAGFPPAPAGITFVDPIVNMGPDANFYRASRDSDAVQAGATGLPGVTGHRSPLGIAFDTAGALCGDYYKQGFFFSFGAVLGSALGDPGKDLLLIRLTKNGATYSMTAKQIVAKSNESFMDSVLVGNKLFAVSYGAGSSVFVFVLPTP